MSFRLAFLKQCLTTGRAQWQKRIDEVLGGAKFLKSGGATKIRVSPSCYPRKYDHAEAVTTSSGDGQTFSGHKVLT
jgi:hypothetical protein